jgi:hypothetical protein
MLPATSCAILNVHSDEPALIIGMLSTGSRASRALDVPVLTGRALHVVRDKLYADFRSAGCASRDCHRLQEQAGAGRRTAASSCTTRPDAREPAETSRAPMMRSPND